jgi:hypothetical protein
MSVKKQINVYALLHFWVLVDKITNKTFKIRMKIGGTIEIIQMSMFPHLWPILTERFEELFG